MFRLVGLVTLLLSAIAVVRAGTTPIGTVEPGTVAGCSWWFENRDGSTDCHNLPFLYDITREQYLSWNPSLTEDCGNFKLGFAYCVRVTESATTTTKTTPSPTSVPNGITTPSPSIPGMVGNCFKFHKVGANDNCTFIASGNKVTTRDLTTWNPYIGASCNYLPVNTNICVGVFPGMPPLVHHGCYTESYVGVPGSSPATYHALNHSSTQGYASMTVEWCSLFCMLEKKQPYFGVELGNQCWCGDSLTMGSTKVAPYLTHCGEPCAGNSSQLCGGKDRIDIYGVEGNPIPISYRPYGCYTEAKNKRALDLWSLRSQDMTVDKCAAYCRRDKTTVHFNVQNGNECWCGDVLAAGSVPAPEADCNSKCAGSSKQTCGGALGRFNLYSGSNSKP